jgi:hypothetical protein
LSCPYIIFLTDSTSSFSSLGILKVVVFISSFNGLQSGLFQRQFVFVLVVFPLTGLYFSFIVFC